MRYQVLDKGIRRLTLIQISVRTILKLAPNTQYSILGPLMTSSATTVTEFQSASALHLFASRLRPLVIVMTALYYVAIIFHRRVWYRTLSLHCECIQSSGIILIPKATLCQILFLWRLPLLSRNITYSITHSLTHPAYLMHRNQSACTEIPIPNTDTGCDVIVIQLLTGNTASKWCMWKVLLGYR